MDSKKKGIYKHFKGGEVEVLFTATHSETLEEYVVYKTLYKTRTKKSIWIRPLKMFLEEVEVNGKKVPRFKFVKA